jgi:hypothetical protein
MELLQKIGEQVLLNVAPILAVALLGWLFAQGKLAWARAKAYAPDWAEAVESAADLAVKAAEQSKLAGLIESKKDYALEIAEQWLKARGVKVDLHLLDAAIEKAVNENFNHDPKASVQLAKIRTPDA